jgi:hypothetical protein
MADTVDSKSTAFAGVPVQVRPQVSNIRDFVFNYTESFSVFRKTLDLLQIMGEDYVR